PTSQTTSQTRSKPLIYPPDAGSVFRGRVTNTIRREVPCRFVTVHYTFGQLFPASRRIILVRAAAPAAQLPRDGKCSNLNRLGCVRPCRRTIACGGVSRRFAP